MDTIETIETLKPFIDLNSLLSTKVQQQSKTDFITFVRQMAPSIVSDFKMGRHIEVISEKLQQLETGEIKRLMVFLPPRSSKSVICSKLFPAWYIGRNPEHEVLTVSHSDQLSSDFGRSVRDIVNDERFTNIFKGVSLRSDVRAAGKWKTNLGGMYYAAGVRSQIAGRGAHIAILDDVMSEEDSYSEAGRRYVKEWYPAGLRTRIMPNGSILIINTMYHYDDLCGWLLKQQDEHSIAPWAVVRIPAWLDEESAELLDLPVGTSYFPEWKPDEILQVDEAEIKASNGARYWNALYMQDPTPDEGGIIKKKWIQWWDQDEPPPCDFIIQTYDTAFSTRTTADFSVIQTWGIFSYMDTDEKGIESWKNNLILLGNIKGRFEYPELRRISQQLYDEYKPDVCMIEKKASGQSLLQDLRMAGVPVLEYMPDRDKEARAHASSALLEDGRIYYPSDKKWAKNLIDICASFPATDNDDIVDTCTQAWLRLRKGWFVTHSNDLEGDEYEEKRRITLYG